MKSGQRNTPAMRMVENDVLHGKVRHPAKAPIWTTIGSSKSVQRIGEIEPSLLARSCALDVHPKNPGEWVDFGSLLLNMGLIEESLKACEQALQIDPSDSIAQTNTVYLLMRMGRLDEAESRCRGMLNFVPWTSDLGLALSECLIRKGDLEQASEILQGLINQEPENIKARNLKGLVHLQQGNMREIRKELERRLDHSTGISIDYERACLNLRFGEMPCGWKQYESRWNIPEFAVCEQRYEQPRWEGEPFVGKTLLLYWEQGFGDTLMFLRYVSGVKRLGGRVLLAVQSDLADLAATCAGVDEIIPHGANIPPFDLQLPLMSLPAVFSTELNSIPADIPYLHVPARVPNLQAIAEKLNASDGRLSAGLVWSGRTTHKNDKQRSIPAGHLLPLASLPGIAWFSFQVGGPAEPPFTAIEQLAPLLSNFSDTAFAISHMDLVITVDTAVAHLSGAMGIPTFLLVPALPDWRWLMGRDDSPWYPTMRIYRQSIPGDWEGVIEKVLADLSTN